MLRHVPKQHQSHRDHLVGWSANLIIRLKVALQQRLTRVENYGTAISAIGHRDSCGNLDQSDLCSAIIRSFFRSPVEGDLQFSTLQALETVVVNQRFVCSCLLKVNPSASVSSQPLYLLTFW